MKKVICILMNKKTYKRRSDYRWGRRVLAILFLVIYYNRPCYLALVYVMKSASFKNLFLSP